MGQTSSNSEQEDETSDTVDAAPRAGSADLPEDEGDARGFLGLFNRNSKGTHDKGKVNTAKMPVDKDSLTYNMNHVRRGVAIIFNHMVFDPARLDLSVRNGTNVDRDNLTSTLTSLDFEVRAYDDKTLREIDKILEGCAAEDHSDADCVLVVVLSHGELNVLYAYDSMYKPDRLWSPFTGDRCPTLAGKPKMFFVQACQGDRFDEGVRLNRTMTTETDSPSAASYRIPTFADFLIAYSSIPGFYSWRSTGRGSWFIQALCDVLGRDSQSNVDLLSMLTRVSKTVALDFQSKSPEDVTMHAMKQVPCVSSMLTRDVIFNRKWRKDN